MKNKYDEVLSKRFIRNLIVMTLMQLCLIPMAFGQTVEVSGTITDESGSGLPGVNIVVEGTSKGTVSDIDGKYALEVEQGNTLIFSFTGYVKESVVVGNESVINMQMTPELSGCLPRVVGANGDVSGTNDPTWRLLHALQPEARRDGRRLVRG